MDVEAIWSTRTITDPIEARGRDCVRSACPPPALLTDHSATSALRADAEAFIRREFLEHFGARISQFMPQLLALHEPHGEIRAVLGYRAATERLFLEAYTRSPIEQIIAERIGCVVPRAQIVEVGSLACRDARAAIEIVKAVIPVLIRAGFTWVVFTGADTVRTVFRRLRLAPHALCVADESMLGDDQHEWGTYYDHDPIVMAGRLVEGLCAVETLQGMQ